MKSFSLEKQARKEDIAGLACDWQVNYDDTRIYDKKQKQKKQWNSNLQRCSRKVKNLQPNS